MEPNMMENDVIVEAAEEIAPMAFKDGLKVAGGIGLAAIGVYAAYKFLIKPRIEKSKDGIVDIPSWKIKDVKDDPEEETEEHTEE